jgi:hypothetical protein
MSAAQPNPVAWPKCSQCDVAFVLRRMLSLSQGWLWLWQRDCKHKSAETVIEQLVGV